MESHRMLRRSKPGLSRPRGGRPGAVLWLRKFDETHIWRRSSSAPDPPADLRWFDDIRPDTTQFIRRLIKSLNPALRAVTVEDGGVPEGPGRARLVFAAGCLPLGLLWVSVLGILGGVGMWFGGAALSGLGSASSSLLEIMPAWMGPSASCAGIVVMVLACFLCMYVTLLGSALGATYVTVAAIDRLESLTKHHMRLDSIRRDAGKIWNRRGSWFERNDDVRVLARLPDDWRTGIRTLIETAPAILVDVTSHSESIDLELNEIRDLGRVADTVLLFARPGPCELTTIRKSLHEVSTSQPVRLPPDPREVLRELAYSSFSRRMWADRQPPGYRTALQGFTVLAFDPAGDAACMAKCRWHLQGWLLARWSC